jgi:predicted nucleic-acid-binding protein
MIAIDTNVMVRMLIDDDERQSRSIRQAMTFAEAQSIPMLVLAEVLIETVWVLESVYHCSRKEICTFLEKLIHTSAFAFTDLQMIRKVVEQYKKKGDFADLMIVYQARSQKAVKLLSFDKQLQKAFPDYVVNNLNEQDILISNR